MKNMWYAIMRDSEDSDWGYGSNDKDEAIKKALDMREKNPDVYIAVISDGDNPTCINEIYFD